MFVRLGNSFWLWQVISVTSLFLLTIPYPDFRYSSGLDSPLAWCFNYLFHHYFFRFPVLAFPYGPLAFLMFPLAVNYLIYLIFYAGVVISLWYCTFQHARLGESDNQKKILFLSWLLCLVALCFLSIIYLLLLIGVSGLWLWHRNPKSRTGLYLSLCCLSLLWYIKITGGILGTFVWLSYGIYVIISRKNFTIIRVLIPAMLISIIPGLILYGNFIHLMKFFYYSVRIIEGNQDLGLYPYSPPWIFILILVLLSIYYFISGITEKKGFFILFLLPLFISFKHGFGREDSSHLHDLLQFLLVCIICEHTCSFQFSFSKGVVSFSLLNIVHLQTSHVFNTDFFLSRPFRLNTLYDLRPTTYSSDYYNELEQKAMIPDSMTFRKLKNRTGDVFPWDQTLLLAHHMKWIPRPSLLINSHPLCDKLNRHFITAPYAPDYILWKKVPLFNGCEYGSMDERYVLNEEPDFIHSFLTHYSYDTMTSSFLVWKKKAHPDTFLRRNKISIPLRPSQYTFIPDSLSSQFLFLRVPFSYPLFPRIKSLLYKPCPIWIKILTKENITLCFRISSYSLQKGIWLQPLLYFRQIFLHPVAFSIHTNDLLFSEGVLETYHYLHHHQIVTPFKVLCSHPEKLRQLRKYNLQLIRDTLPFLNYDNFKYQPDAVPENPLLFRFSPDSILQAGSFIRIEIPVFHGKLKYPKEIKITLCYKEGSGIWKVMREYSMANFMKKEMDFSTVEMLFPDYFFERNKEYAIFIHNLLQEDIRMMPGKFSVYQPIHHP